MTRLDPAVPVEMNGDDDDTAITSVRANPDQKALGITETVEYPADAEMGESVEIIVEDGRIEAFLSDNVFVLDPASPDARFALRAYAYALARRGQLDEAKHLLRELGREG